MSSCPVKKPTASASVPTAMTSSPSTTAPSARFGRARAGRAALRRRPEPSTGCPWSAGRTVEGQFADGRIRRNRVEVSCPLAPSKPSAIGRSNAAASLGRSAGERLMTIRSTGRVIAAVDHRPLDPVRAFLDGRLGQADQDRLGQGPGRNIDLDLDRQGLDPEQRIRSEPGEHREANLQDPAPRRGTSFCGDRGADEEAASQSQKEPSALVGRSLISPGLRPQPGLKPQGGETFIARVGAHAGPGSQTAKHPTFPAPTGRDNRSGASPVRRGERVPSRLRISRGIFSTTKPPRAPSRFRTQQVCISWCPWSFWWLTIL